MSWTFKLCDLATDSELVDLTPRALSAKLSPRLNRPLTTVYELPADDSTLRALALDGDLNLTVGTRCIKAFQGGTLRANTLVWNLEYQGDADTTKVMVTGYDPMILLRFRPVRDSTGNLVDPTFASPIAGATILKNAIDNSVTYEGALPITTTGGTFNTTIPPATNLAAELTDWPTTIGDLLTLLTDTGVVDVVMDPIEGAGLLARLSILNQRGTDRTGAVHFDYATGAHSIQNIRRVFDMDQLCNKLYYYLGPKKTTTRWAGNITATETGLEAYDALQTASRAKYGTYMDIRIYDSNGTENSARPLFHQLWKEEVTLRVSPRELLYVQPTTDAGFEPFTDFNIGDTFSLNASDIIGPTFTGAIQRIYGFDVDIDADGVQRVGELICSADAE
jgi:hypothetical protein